MKRKLCIVLLLSLMAISLVAQPKREFRASWLTTVWAIDWPASWGQPNASGQTAQQNELMAIVDSLEVARMNAVYFQVRGFCDAMYNSKYEPWSKYLTGTRGGVPKYDPLGLLVEYAHSKGIEVHAWMNPYRYSTSDDTYGKLDTDYSKTHPEWLVACGGYYILNPCLPEVKERIAAVVADLVGKYDVDGVIFDDYFYQSGYQNSYEEAYYAATGNGLSRADWRREQVNDMVRMVRDTIKATKPWVSFGIGPAGIAGKSNTSAPVYGVDGCPVGSDWQYNGIYSDPLAWYDRKLIDYMAPQCYWKIGAGNDYDQLSEWWSYIAGHFNRHVYISQDLSGLVAPTASTGSTTFHSDEIAAQMQLDRDYDLMGAPGCSWYSLKSGIKTKDFLRDIRNTVNTRPALVPMKSWCRTDEMLFVSDIQYSGSYLSWKAPASRLRYAVYAIPSDSVGYAGITGSSRYLLGTSYETSWQIQSVDNSKTYAVAVLDRYGNEYPARTMGNTELGTSAAAQLTFPAEGAAVLLPCMFTWQRADKADSYFFQLSTDADFATVDYECETVEPAFNVGKINWLENNITYYWRVRTRSINRTDTYSETRSFSGTYFHIQSPEDGTRDWPVTLTIVTDSVPAQTAEYHFEIATGNNFASTLVWQADAPVPHVQVPADILLYSTYYYVRCIVTYNGTTAVAPACRFRTVAQDVPVPVITSPADGEQIVSTDITVCWQQQPSSGFRIELSTAETFPGRKTKIANEDYTAFCHTYTGLDPAEYYIRVKALADGAWTDPSEVVHVTLVKPTSVEDTHAAAVPAKLIRDGQLLIQVNGECYDMLGNKTTQ